MIEFACRIYILLHTRSILVGAAEILFSGSLLLLLLMVIHKILLERREKALMEKKKFFSTSCYRRLSDSSSPLPNPKGNAEWQALIDVLIHIMREAPPDKIMSVQSLARQLNVADRLIPNLRSRSWITRLKAAEQFGFLKLREAAPVLGDALAQERDIHVIAKLLWGLSLVGKSDEAHLIVSFLVRQPIISSKFNELLFGNLIGSFCADAAYQECITLFEEFLHDNDIPLIIKRALIEACGSSKFIQAADLVKKAFADFGNEPSMRIACIRALGNLEADSRGEIMIPSLDDNDWRVRAVAARYAIRAASTAVPKLGVLLGDPNYHVRMNAALSLSNMGEKGQRMLRQSLKSADRFVRDVSAYALGRTGWQTA